MLLKELLKLIKISEHSQMDPPDAVSRASAKDVENFLTGRWKFVGSDNNILQLTNNGKVYTIAEFPSSGSTTQKRIISGDKEVPSAVSYQKHADTKEKTKSFILSALRDLTNSEENAIGPFKDRLGNDIVVFKPEHGRHQTMWLKLLHPDQSDFGIVNVGDTVNSTVKPIYVSQVKSAIISKLNRYYNKCDDVERSNLLENAQPIEV